MTSLTPLWYPRPRVQQQPAKARVPAPADPVLVPSVFAPVAPQPSVEHLTVADVAGLSFEWIAALVPINPKLVADLIVESGKMRRAKSPMRTSTMRPMARAILLSGERRRGRELNEEDAAFMADFLKSIGAS